MPDGVKSVADMTIIVDAQISEAVKGLSTIEGILNNFAGAGSDKLKFFDGKLGGIATTVAGLVGRFNLWLGAFQSVLQILEKASGSAEQFASKVGATEQYERFKQALDDLAATAGEIYTEKMDMAKAATESLKASAGDAPSAGLPLSQWLDTITDKAVGVVHEFQGIVEWMGRAPDARSDVGLIAQIDRLKERMAELDADIKARESDSVAGALARLFGLTADQARQEREKIEDEAILLQATIDARRELLGLDVAIPLQRTPVDVPEVTAAIEALKKQNEELQIQGAVFGMAAGAAARYRAEQVLLRQLGAEGGGLVSEDNLRALREQYDALERNTKAIDDQRRAKRQDEEDKRKAKQAEHILGGGEREVLQLEQRARAMTMNASEAARMAAEERMLLQFRLAGIPITEESSRRIRELAEAQGEATARVSEMTRQMSQIQELGRTVASSLEDAFGKWIKGTHVSWKEFISDLTQDMAKLAFRQALQPIFGGGSGGGTSFLASLFNFGGGRASGGPANAGMAYQWQEAGREYFVPNVDGMVMKAGQGGGITVNAPLTINTQSGDPNELAPALQDHVELIRQVVHETFDRDGRFSRSGL